MEYSADNLRDFHQYFQDCWIGKMEEDGSVNIFYVRGTADGAVLVSTAPNTKDKTKITVPFQEIMGGNYLVVPRYIGMVCVQDTCAYVFRSPKRTARKGFCKSTFHWFVPNHELLTTYDLSIGIKEVANALFNPLKLEYRVLIEKINKGLLLGGAVSQHLGLFIQDGIENIQVLYKTNVVGIAEPDKITISRPWEMYKERIEERLGLEVAVK